MSEATLPLQAAAPPRFSEDLVAVGLGLLVFLLALGSLAGADALGWLVTTSVWTNPSLALAPVSKAYASLGGAGSLLLTYLVLTAVLSAAAYLLGDDVKRFAAAFTGVFVIAYASWFVGSWAYLAAVTPADQAKFGVSWSLKLTNEGGYIVALLAGLVIANAFPAFAERLKSAVRPELYIKIAIVILGAFIAVTMASKLTLASSLMLRGVAAIIEAYLIYWPIVYLIARKGFGFSREWAAPLASGVSICGVAAAIATGGAIRARPQIPILVSSLVVVFAVIEVLILPFIAQAFMSHEPLVAAAWMGLAVKTDGAALAAGGITQSLIQAKAAAEGIAYQPGWMLTVTATVKVFIDVFIGVWAFILAYIWTNHINPQAGGSKAKLGEIWERFPEVHSRLRRDIPDHSSARALDRRRRIGPAHRGDRRSQCAARDLLRADLLLDRRDVQLSPALAGGLRQARGGLSGVVVWLRRVGRVCHLMALLRRRQTAACVLI